MRFAQSPGKKDCWHACYIERNQLFCSLEKYFKLEVRKLRRIIYNNGYTNIIFNNILHRFLHESKQHNLTATTEEVPVQRIFLRLPYLGQTSERFFKNIQQLAKQKLNVVIQPIYASCKVGQYFQLKSQMPLPLRANVEYKFTCSRDVSLTYTGTSSRHLCVKIKKHLDEAKSNKSAIKVHIMQCQTCSSRQNSELVSAFSFIRKCKTFEAKIHKASMIKRQNPKLNKQY